MELIEKYTNDNAGYLPLLMGNKWQVAILNYALEETLGHIDKLDIHHHTDEVFVLLDGHAVLIAARIDESGVHYETADMKPFCVYNIPRDVWHKIAMEPDSRVLIVENAGTHLGDFEFYELSGEEVASLRGMVAKAVQNR